MWTPRQLGWIAKNGRRPQTTQLLAALADPIVTRARRASVRNEAFLGVLEELMDDDDARLRCTPGPVRRGVLNIYVNDERLCSAYQMRWAEPLGRQLAADCPRLGVRQVRFVPAQGRHTGSTNP